VKTRFLASLRPLAILGTALVVAALMIISKPELRARDSRLPLPLVEVQRVQKESLPVTVVAYGNVAAAQELEMAAQVTGRIIWKSEQFEPGVVVPADTPLLRIDATDYRLALAEARQALASAELALADARALRQSAREKEAEAVVASARARIERAERDLDNTEIRVPYDAVIDQQLVELGQFISTGTRIGRILGTARAEVRLPIPPQDILFLDGDSRAPVRLTSTVGASPRSWEGVLTRIEARVDEQTRVFPAIVSVARPLDRERHAQPLPFGLFLRAEIPGRAIADSVRIPQSALHGESDVFLFVDGSLRRVTVEVARINGGQALVTEGLSGGDAVVTTRLDLMFDGMQVALVDG
jgi:multidrug efflux pump subunit AcrA (membrane-fusion protein)